MNTHKRTEMPRQQTPTSVKKPAIPAWQEPCSSPYFFLYSRGKEGERSKPQPCQCVPAVRGASRANRPLPASAAAGWAQGRRPDCGVVQVWQPVTSVTHGFRLFPSHSSAVSVCGLSHGPVVHGSRRESVENPPTHKRLPPTAFWLQIVTWLQLQCKGSCKWTSSCVPGKKKVNWDSVNS